MVNVKSKGAKGDGLTDDAAAIQLAVNEVAEHGHVLIADGVDMVDASRAEPHHAQEPHVGASYRQALVLKAIPNGATH